MDQLTLLATESFERDFVDELLAKLAPTGYTEVWLGATSHSHWGHGMSSGVIAAPRLRTRHRDIPLWRVLDALGRLGCGNGLRHADQAQVYWHDPWPGTCWFHFRATAGHYVLCDGVWEKRS
jgi:hypothetical protein